MYCFLSLKSFTSQVNVSRIGRYFHLFVVVFFFEEIYLMNVLHYSFSLSACPKCHLLVCKHTSLANLDFNVNQQQIQSSHTTISGENYFRSNGTNIYLFPPTISNNRYSWTTFGTESINTLNNQTICENIPFANETIINSIPIQLNHQPTKSLSISTITNKFLSFPSIKHRDHLLMKSYSLFFIILLFLITNTIDIVLIYIYYHLHYIYLISYLSTIILCDVILWLNNLIQSKSIPSYLLLMPFSIRFYLLYKLLELLLIIIDYNKNSNIFHSLYKTNKSKLYQNLTLFYLIHTGFFSFVNLYFWSNNFQLSREFVLNMDYFIPQWIVNNQLLSSTMDTITTHSSLG
jgi:hypothetical protein